MSETIMADAPDLQPGLNGKPVDFARAVTWTTSRWHNPALEALSRTALMVGTVYGLPKWPLRYRYINVSELAPDARMLRLDYPDFRRHYRAKLHRSEESGELEVVLRKLVLEAEHEHKATIVLLCYEDIRGTDLATLPDQPWNENWCHRMLLAEYLAPRLGLPVTELVDTSKPKAPKGGSGAGGGGGGSTVMAPLRPTTDQGQRPSYLATSLWGESEEPPTKWEYGARAGS